MARDDLSPTLPSPELAAHARALLNSLDSHDARFVLWDRTADHQIELNEELYELLRNILIDLAQNRAIQVLPHDMELTTVQAADFLHVSRPHVIKLIDEGKLPCRLVGTHRRLKLKDLIDYGTRQATDGRRAREEMTKEAEQLGWGY
jgi:excisionase family DNA binding protein